MSGKWLIPAIAAIAAGLLAFGASRHLACPAPETGLERLRDVAFLSRELTLNEAQTRSIAALHAELSARLADCCDRYCAARLRMVETLTDDAQDAAQAEAAVEEMFLAYAESERAALNHVLQLREVLDPEQRQRLNDLLIKTLGQTCQTCPTCRQGSECHGQIHH